MNDKIQTYIQRRLAAALKESLNTFPITALLCPRQCGKSTLAKHIIRDYQNTTYLDLEKPSDQRKLEEAPLSRTIAKSFQIRSITRREPSDDSKIFGHHGADFHGTHLTAIDSKY